MSPGLASSVHSVLHIMSCLWALASSRSRTMAEEQELMPPLSVGVKILREGEALCRGQPYFSAIFWNEPCLCCATALTAYLGSSPSFTKSLRFKMSFQVLVIQMIGNFYPPRAQFFPPHACVVLVTHNQGPRRRRLQEKAVCLERKEGLWVSGKEVWRCSYSPQHPPAPVRVVLSPGGR